MTLRILGIFLLISAAVFTRAQDAGAESGGRGTRIEGRAKFMPVPYINYDRSLGFSFGAVPMLMFNPVERDTVSPSSLVGGLGMYTTNKTWMAMGFGMFYLDEDKWRIATAGGYGNIHYQFYLDFLWGFWLPYQVEAGFFFARVERKIRNHLYGGLSYMRAHMVTGLDNLPVSDTLSLNGIGFNLSLDHRNSPHYPRSGYLSDASIVLFPGMLGNDNVSQKIKLEHNHYFPVRKNMDVAAARIFVGLAPGDPGFNQQFIVSGKDIRGYTQGAFRGNYLLALQGEYRWNFHRRWGAVAFGGVATVFKAINEADNGRLLPGGGAGIRFRAFPENNFSVGMDIAAGVDDWGIYFQIGEAF